jgi:hypothetical protein
MPVILDLCLSILLGCGFYFFGKLFVNIFKLTNIIQYISNPIYQYPIIGISFFLFILFPFFLLGIFNNSFFKLSSYLIITIGLLSCFTRHNNFYNFICKNKIKFKDITLVKVLVITLIFLYLLISLSPVTSADSLSYHLAVAKFINKNGFFSNDQLDFEGKLAGIGEFLNAFAISINAEQFTSFVNFLGLIAILGIISKLSHRQKINEDSKYFLMLLVLSCPSLIFLISSSKPQFLYISLVFFSYSFLVIINIIKKNYKYILTIFFLVNILLLVAVNAKLNFLLSFLIINFIFFYYLQKLYNKKFFFWIVSLFFLLIFFGLLPFVIWKSINYQYPFYNFLTNPLPLNLPVYDNFSQFLKNYQSEKFPFILLFPLEIGDFTQIIGIGFLGVIFLFINKFKNKFFFLTIILLFIIIFYFIGQKTSRFYLEIFFFMILILTQLIKKIQNQKIFILFKYLIFFQSFAVIFALTLGVFNIFPGSLNSYLKDKVLTNYADGYSLIKWTNLVLPKDTKIIISHRSKFFLNVNYIHTDPLGYMNYNSIHKNYYLNKIKDQNPSFILFYGSKASFNYGEFNFEDCIDELFAKKENAGFQANRNPFNTKNIMYDAYIYYLNNSKMPNCVKSN